ncbi:MAG: MazG-like family protein [Thermoanaerobaculales bacterium]
MSFEKLIARANAIRDARDWRQFHDPKDLMLSLCLEAAELLEHAQWRNGEALKSYLAEHQDEIGQELADVLYWALLLSDDLGIDLEDAFCRKMDLIEKRYPVEKARGRATKYDKL